MNENLIIINNGDKNLAIILKKKYTCEGVNFITPEYYPQQLAYMHHPSGKKIDAHIHLEKRRDVLSSTQEVLIIKKGKLRVDFYDERKSYIRSCLLENGDVILFVSGGHGFEVLEEVEMIEVKQGPYNADTDKERFNGISDGEAIVW